MTNSFLSYKQLRIQNHLAVLPCGDLSDNKINNWTVGQLKPYLSFISKEKTIDNMFGGLIFNIISTRENRYIYPLYTSFGKLAVKKDWHLAVANLFKKNLNFYAAASETNRIIDIWVSLPYPLSLQHNFGKINRKILNFENEEDRLIALKWWIDSFLKRWTMETYLHSTLILRGFVWQRESIGGEDVSLVKKINSYIHLHHLLTMWLPNYGASGVIDWKSLKFNAVCINPNYYGSTDHDYQWINNAASFAQFYNNGMQIYYGKGIIFNDTHLLDYLNIGLEQYNKYMKNCLLVFQFPNQTLKDVYEKNFVNYKRLYSFINEKYTKVSYPGIPY